MKNHLTLILLFAGCGAFALPGEAAAETPAALAELRGAGGTAAEAAPAPAEPERAVAGKYFSGTELFDYKPDATAKAAEYAASIASAGLEVLGTSILSREDGDRDLYYFSIAYAGPATLKSEQQEGIPDKLRAGVIHDGLTAGFTRAGMRVVRSGVRKEKGAYTFFTAYCVYAQEDGDSRQVRTYVSLPRQQNQTVDASPLFPENLEKAAAALEGAGMPIVFRLRGSTGWMIKFVSDARPVRLRSAAFGSYTAALEDMRAAVARLGSEGKIVLDASTELVGSYWTVDYIDGK